tara:strand:- start:190 stop:360 length:171 start_codon:yes stop_codon:yes gene_type:complete
VETSVWQTAIWKRAFHGSLALIGGASDVGLKPTKIGKEYPKPSRKVSTKGFSFILV